MMNKQTVLDFIKKYPMSILLAIIAINLFSIAGSLKENAKRNQIELAIDNMDSKSHSYLSIFAGRIAKNSSRQGTQDEALQIEVCAKAAANFNIKIENLSSTAFRATKNEPTILSNNEFKERKINKSETLKSFDAKISGDLNGWVCAKVCYGAGGHQDNVFEEMYNYCEWVDQYHANSNQLFVVLIDTDLTKQFNELKEKYEKIKNILIVDHIGFQNYLNHHHQLSHTNYLVL